MRRPDALRAARLAADKQIALGMVSLERAAARRPRALLHGVVALVGLTVVASAAAESRGPTAAPAQPALAAQSPALVDLPMRAPLDVDRPTPSDNELVGPPPLPDKKAPAKPVMHTVAEGETLRMLAARYGVEPETILYANSLRDPDMLQVGQDLTIPPTDGVLSASTSRRHQLPEPTSHCRQPATSSQWRAGPAARSR